MTGINEFLVARLREDEAQARDAASRNAAQWSCPASAVLDVGDDDFVLVHDSGVGEHMRRWDPARVLREVETKRRILDLHKVNVEVEGAPPRFPHPHVRYQQGRVTYWCDRCDHDRDYGHISGPDEGCPTLRLLAAPYADHPDFNPTWRLDA